MVDKKSTFETALKNLEDIVKKMEEGELSLDQSLKKFEEGMDWVKFCEKNLNEAEGRVEKLMKDSEGNKKRVPFEVEDV